MMLYAKCCNFTSLVTSLHQASPLKRMRIASVLLPRERWHPAPIRQQASTHSQRPSPAPGHVASLEQNTIFAMCPDEALYNLEMIAGKSLAVESIFLVPFNRTTLIALNPAPIMPLNPKP